MLDVALEVSCSPEGGEGRAGRLLWRNRASVVGKRPAWPCARPSTVAKPRQDIQIAMSFFFNPSDTRDKKKLAAEMTDKLFERLPISQLVFGATAPAADEAALRKFHGNWKNSVRMGHFPNSETSERDQVLKLMKEHGGDPSKAFAALAESKGRSVSELNPRAAAAAAAEARAGKKRKAGPSPIEPIEEPDTTSDEELAKHLQAEFDKEIEFVKKVKKEPEVIDLR